jgi:hypothetical protein
VKEQWKRALTLMVLAHSNKRIQVRLRGSGPTLARGRAEAALDQYFDLVEATRATHCALVEGPETEREMWRRRFCNT